MSMAVMYAIVWDTASIDFSGNEPLRKMSLGCGTTFLEGSN